MKSNYVYHTAAHWLGLEEWEGKDSNNPHVLDFFKDAGHDWVKDDETPWCAAFVNSVLKDCGIQGTGKLNARSFSQWGSAARLETANLGDIVVFWRESPDSWKGHVAFFAGFDNNGDILALGGNQGDSVSVQTYPRERVLTVRRSM